MMADVYGFPIGHFARLFCVKRGLCGQILELIVDKFKFVGFPTQLPTQSTHETTYFNFVLVMDAADPDSPFYADVISKFSRAVEHEQRRCAFFSREVQRILAVRDE
jgi:hypothetical protein